MAQAIGDELGFDMIPTPVVGVIVVVSVDGVGSTSFGFAEAEDDPPYRFGRTEEAVVVAAMANKFASNTILLVIEL